MHFFQSFGPFWAFFDEKTTFKTLVIGYIFLRYYLVIALTITYPKAWHWLIFVGDFGISATKIAGDFGISATIIAGDLDFFVKILAYINYFNTL